MKIYTRKGDDGSTGSGTAAGGRSRTTGSTPTAPSTRPTRLSASRAPCAAPRRPRSPPTSSTSSAICSSPAPNSPRRPRRPAASRTASAGSRRGDGRRPRAGHRPLHGPGRAAAEVRDPRRHPALGAPSTSHARSCAGPNAGSQPSPRTISSRRAPSSPTSTAPPTSSTRWRASPTSPTRSCSRAAGEAEPLRRRPPALRAIARPSTVDGHELIVDEPPEDGGADDGHAPDELLAASLASCTATTIEMYADRKEWDIDGSRGRRSTSRAPRRSATRRTSTSRCTSRTGSTTSSASRLLVIAGKCPVHRMLVDGADVETTSRPRAAEA